MSRQDSSSFDWHRIDSTSAANHNVGLERTALCAERYKYSCMMLAIWRGSSFSWWVVLVKEWFDRYRHRFKVGCKASRVDTLFTEYVGFRVISENVSRWYVKSLHLHVFKLPC